MSSFFRAKSMIRSIVIVLIIFFFSAQLIIWPDPVYADEEESIYVEDNGTGMTQEEFNQNIFPKDSMIVRGMGLSIATVIFEEHNYSIEVIPKEMGTIMKIKKKKFLNNTE